MRGKRGYGLIQAFDLNLSERRLLLGLVELTLLVVLRQIELHLTLFVLECLDIIVVLCRYLALGMAAVCWLEG